MPNMDGIESTKRIRQLGFSAPIIALTAFADESNREACLNAGMNAFLAKPIKRPSLKQEIKRPPVRKPDVIHSKSPSGS